MAKILIVEDELVIRELLADNLEFEGYCPTPTETLAEGEVELQKQNFDLILLDINLPDGNGAERLQQWRSNGLNIPVIVCTIRDREIDVVKALEAGADDYVTKPFRIRELMARIKAVLRRADARTASSATPIGRIVVDFAARTVSSQGKNAVLTATEWQILEYMWNNRNQVLSRNQIIEHIWGINDLEDSRAVDVHVGRLRKKIEPETEPEFLLTVRGIGYMLKI
jgi:two-component system alkaline phosphatase synthesis response regulator PhoP